MKPVTIKALKKAVKALDDSKVSKKGRQLAPPYCGVKPERVLTIKIPLLDWVRLTGGEIEEIVINREMVEIPKEWRNRK